jgi:beta-lactamase superfamily II metal-dependent hydrolase
MTGDMGEEGEAVAIRSGADLKSDILKVGHHGSKTSTSEEFLEAVDPKYAVIQSGKNNFGHPTKEVLERLKAHSTKILRNDISGAIRLR